MKRIATLMILGTVLLAASSDAVVFYAKNASIKQVAEGYLYINGETAEYIDVPQDGTYTVSVMALGTACGGVWPIMALSLDGFPRQTLTVGSSSLLQYNYTTQLTAGAHSIGVAFMNDGLSTTEDRNLYLDKMAVYSPSGVADSVLSNVTDWMADMQTRETALLAATNASIATYRMGPATVTVTDASGNVLSGATVSVEQTKHDFLFGSNLCSYQCFDTAAKNATYLQRFADVFNYATVPFYWSQLEATQGSPNYAWTDAMVNWCTTNGITVKGHALLWAAPAALPAWSNGSIPSVTLQQAHVTEIMNRYSGLIRNWEVVNEPINEPGIDIANPHTWARALDSDGVIISNECGHLYNGLQAHYDLLQKTIANGTPLDAVGLQAHYPADGACPLERLQYVLNKYAALNKDIHITEFTPPSNGNPILEATWRGTWTEDAQAQYAEDFYRTCFAHPSVAAISWWDFTDLGAWIANGGLLRSDLSSKPAYTALYNLIRNEWHTSTSGSTASTGAYGFSGYYGWYTVTVTYGGVSKQVSVHVTKGGTNNFTVNMTVPTASVNTLVTKTTKPTITGTFSNATSVNVSLDGSTWYAATISGSTWSITWASTLSAGVYNVRAKATDAAGNSVSDSTTGELTIDTTIPVITLTGSSSVSIKKGSTYTDAGATATDNISGTISSRIVVTSTVKTSTIGTYYVRYNVKDDAGNAATQKTRTVKVTY